MIIAITIPALTVTKTAEEWRQILVDPSAFQTELRAALAAQRAAADERPGNIAFANTKYNVDGNKIKKAAAKQNAKTANRFLAPDETFECEFCGKTFDRQKTLNIHRGKMHKAEISSKFPNLAQPANDASAE